MTKTPNNSPATQQSTEVRFRQLHGGRRRRASVARIRREMIHEVSQCAWLAALRKLRNFRSSWWQGNSRGFPHRIGVPGSRELIAPAFLLLAASVIHGSVTSENYPNTKAFSGRDRRHGGRSSIRGKRRSRAIPRPWLFLEPGRFRKCIGICGIQRRA